MKEQITKKFEEIKRLADKRHELDEREMFYLISEIADQVSNLEYTFKKLIAQHETELNDLRARVQEEAVARNKQEPPTYAYHACVTAV